MKTAALPIALVLGFVHFAEPAQGAFHVMQIEQIIGSIEGNTNAQAIQLRLRSGGQNQVQSSRIKVYDANGANPITLLDIGTAVSNSTAGDNILLTSTAFDVLMSNVPGYAKDFTLSSTIPLSYLAGGKVTFERDTGSILWSVAYGNYVGTNLAGESTNDADSNFGAPFAGALPTNARQGIRFTGTATAGSTTNAADYALTANPATVRNNARSSFTVVPEPGTVALLSFGAVAFGGLAYGRRRSAR